MKKIRNNQAPPGGSMKKYLSMVCLMALLFCSCQGGEEQTMDDKKDLSLEQKKILMVIAHENFRDEEFSEPHTLFTNAGALVTVASTDTSEAKGMLGMMVKPDILIDEADALDYEAIVLIGGSGSTALWDNTKLHEILRVAHQEKKVIGAICLSPVTLAKAEIVEGKTLACYKTPAVEEVFKEHNVQLSGNALEVEENIVTANGPAAATAYAEKITQLLQ
jgi:protease I